jgi:4-hydroxy-4-methyl-2-oxoglutarate aldolase
MQHGSLGFCAVTRPSGPRPEDYGPLSEYRSCDISDAINKSHTMRGIQPAYKPIGRVVGPAITVSIPGSGFEMISAAMHHAKPGDILVIDTHGDTQSAFWGGYMSNLAKELGLAGVVLDGALRDRDEIQAHGFAAFSRTVATRVGVLRGSWGEINMPIACGGIPVSAGAIIVADEDGVVVIPPAWLDRTIEDVKAFVSSDAQLPPVADIEAGLRADGLTILASEAG